MDSDDPKVCYQFPHKWIEADRTPLNSDTVQVKDVCKNCAAVRTWFERPPVDSSK